MVASGVRPTTRAYNALIGAFVGPGPPHSPGSRTHARASSLPDALLVLREMRASGVSPDVYTFNRLISAAARARDLDRALGLFEEMQAVHGLSPDAVTFASLVDACGKARGGARWTRALSVFEEMLARGVAPTAHAYTALIHACGEGGEPQEAARLLAEMKGTGIAPTRATYAVMVRVWGKAGEVKRAVGVFREMREAGVAPDAGSYTALVHACLGAGDWRAAAAVARQMPEGLRGQGPDAGTRQAVRRAEAAAADAVGAAGAAGAGVTVHVAGRRGGRSRGVVTSTSDGAIGKRAAGNGWRLEPGRAPDFQA